MVLETTVAVLSGGASVVVSAAAIGTYRAAREVAELTRANRRDLRGGEPDDRGVVHHVREHRQVLSEYGLLSRDYRPVDDEEDSAEL